MALSVEFSIITFKSCRTLWKASQNHFVLNWTFSCFIHSFLFPFFFLSLCIVIFVFHVFIYWFSYRICQKSDFQRGPERLTVNSKDNDPFHTNKDAILVFWHLYTKLHAFGKKNCFLLPTVCRFHVFIITCSVVFGRHSNCPTNVQRVRQWAEPVLLCVVCLNPSLSKGRSVKKKQ